MQFVWALRPDLEPVHLEPEARRHTEVGDPLRGPDAPAAGADPRGELVHLRQLITQGPLPPVFTLPSLRGKGHTPDMGAVKGLRREATAFGPQAAAGEKLLRDRAKATQGPKGCQVMPSLKQVLLQRASEGRLPAGKLLPEGPQVQRCGAVREEVLDGLHEEKEERVTARTGLRATLGDGGREALHQGRQVARVAHVASTSWKHGAALGGIRGRKRGGLGWPPLLHKLLQRKRLLLPRGPKPMQELPLERPGRGLQGHGNDDVGKLRGQLGEWMAAAGSVGRARVLGMSLRRSGVGSLGLVLPGPARPAAPGARVGHIAASGPGTRWWSACVSAGPASGARGDDEVDSASGAGGSSRLPSPSSWGGGATSPKAGSGPSLSAFSSSSRPALPLGFWLALLFPVRGCCSCGL